MVHVFVIDDDVVLRSHVVRDVVIHDQPQQAVQQRQVNLLRNVFELGLENDDALAIRGVPHIRQVIDALAPLVHQERSWLGVRRLDPVGEQMTVVALIPEVLVKVGIGDLLKRLDLVARRQVRVHVLELNRDLLEGTLRQQVALDAAQSLMRIVVGLLDETQLLTLRLVQARLHGVLLLQPLEGQDEQLGVVLVIEGRERDRRELAGLEPVDSRGVDGHSLLPADIRSVLEVVVLPLLLGLQPQAREPAQILLARRLVDGRATANTLTVVVGGIGPPVGLGLHIPEDHVLDRSRQAGHLPRNVGLPAAPGLGQVLQDGPGLVRAHALRHHVDDVVHDGRAQLEVEVTLYTLLRDGLRDTLGDTALELPRQQVAQPTLQKRHDATEEEEPHAPAWCPEATARPLADWARVESVVDQVLQVLAHADLPHQTVLVPVHTGQLTDVREDVLQAIGQLERVDVAQAELHMTVDHKLCQTHDLTAQMERIAEARLFALLRREGLHRLQVEVVIQVQEIEILTGDQQVQHVVTLTTHLQADLDPVQLGALEELGGRENVHQVALVEGLRRAVVQLVEHPHLQQLLVGHAHLHRVVGRAVLLVPLASQWHILCSAHVAAAQVERPRSPVERDAVRSAVREQWRVVQQRLHRLRQLESLDGVHICRVLRSVRNRAVRRQGIHDRIVVERGQVRVIRLDVHNCLVVVPTEHDLPRARVVEERERDAVLRTELLTHDDLVDVIELIPVLVLVVHVAVKRLEFGASGDRHVQGLGGVERLLLKEVEVVLVHEVGQQLVRKAVQNALLRQGQSPPAVAGTVDLLRVEQRARIVEPVDDGLILVVVQFHLDGLEGLDIQHVVTVIQRRLLIIERREAHALEVATVTLLSSHHDPHGAPLRQIDGLDDLLALCTERDGTTAVVDRPAIPDLLPWHGHVLEELVDGVRQVLQGAQVDALVVAELARRHVSVVLDNLTDVLRGHLFLLLLNHTELALLTVPLGVQGLPLTGLFVEELLLGLLRLPVRCPVVRILRHSGSHLQPWCRSHVHLRLVLVRARHARGKDKRVHS
mmetsp:Transcript_33281/g.109100  ORF Transcript_33281/g.109100 Transcript_33281/m.109100 type:complete len:1053 (+) Transcript_33281:4096-7254(+)